MGNARLQPRLSSVRSVALRAEQFYDRSGRVFPWRRPAATRYHQVVTEVLLQQTRADTVAGFFPIFLEHFPNWSALANATEEEIRQVIRPLGLWRRRARSLQRLAREVSQRGGRFPVERTRLEAMPAVGQYVANAVELFCHGRPRPLLDGGMARILERYFGPRDLADIRHDPYLQCLAQRLSGAAQDPRKLSWGLLDIAALHCMPRCPRCKKCPIKKGCKSYSTQASILGKGTPLLHQDGKK